MSIIPQPIETLVLAVILFNGIISTALLGVMITMRTYGVIIYNIFNLICLEVTWRKILRRPLLILYYLFFRWPIQYWQGTLGNWSSMSCNGWIFTQPHRVQRFRSSLPTPEPDNSESQ